MTEHPDVGPYAITGVLGRGGMGVVYAGTHRGTGVSAAVKTVAAIDVDKTSQIRREIDSLARLRHPGVVRVLDYSTTSALPWYAMERLDGLTLERLCGQFWASLPADAGVTRLASDDVETGSAAVFTNPAPASDRRPAPEGRTVPRPPAANGHLSKALGLLQRLCEVLAYVHGEGVVHRDLKPSNVFVTADGLPVLVDFGLVAFIGSTTSREVLDEVRIAGSVKYMAPEQIDGELLDPRTDIYALGCLTYEVITGRPPFEGALGHVVDQHRHARPTPPSELVLGLPDELDQLVMRMLEKVPRDRLSYASDFAALARKLGAQAPRWPGELPRTRTYLCRPPLVGRQDLLLEVDGVVRRLEQRRGGLVVVSGESGVGKTRLALEVAWRATARGSRVVAGACQPVLRDEASGAQILGAPLHPLTPLMQLIADHCSEAGLEESERVVGDRGPVLAVYETAFRSVPGQAARQAPDPLPLAASRDRLYRSLAGTIDAFVSRTPTLMLLDDLHWADELTMGFLDYLVRGRIADMPLLVVGTYRPEEAGTAIGALIDIGHPLSIRVEKLSFSAVGDMVAGMLAIRRPPQEFVAFLASKSEGNPFFVMEYLRVAVAEQVVVRRPTGEWTFAETTDPTGVLCESLPLPRSLRDVITRRLDSLSPAARRVVNCGTLVGREFDAETVRAAVEISLEAMVSLLSELVDRHVVEESGGGSAYRFTHDKLREISDVSLDDDERRRWHRAIATAIDQQPDDEDRDASLGHHWSAAGDPLRAIPHLHRAGDRAHALHALADAAELYRATLRDVARLPTGAAGSGDVATLREKLADTLAVSGAHDQARVEFARAIDALGPRRSVDSARLWRKVGKTLETTHDHAGALDAYARAEAELGAVDEPHRDAAWRAESIQVRLNRIWVFYWQARIAEMDAELEAVAPVVDAHGLPLQRSSYFQAIVTRNYRQDRYVITDETLGHARQSLVSALEAGARSEAAFARFILGFGLLFHGDLAEAEAELSEALQEARRLGDVTSQVRSLAYLVIVSRRRGRVGDTRALARDALSLASSIRMHDYIGVAHAGLGWVAWKCGDVDAARTECQAAIDAWAQPSYVYPFQWTSVLTMLAVQTSRAPVRQLISLAETMLDVRQMRLPNAILEPLEASVAAYRAEDKDEARDALVRAVNSAERLGYL